MKKKINYLYTILIFIAFGSSQLYSQVNLNQIGQSTMDFLLVGTSPKACALGEAFTAAGVGSESMFYNPAGLTEMQKDFDVNINYTQWIADINYLSGGIAWNLGNNGVVGLNLLTVNYGTIYGTSLLPTGDNNPDDINRGYIDNGNLSNVNAYAVGLSYARAISTAFSIGGTVKFVGQNLGSSLLASGMKENNATKLVFDAGVMYRTTFKSFRFGMDIRNFSTTIKRELVEEQLPLLFSLGAAMNLFELVNEEYAKTNFLNFSVDFLHPNNYSERVNLGLEYIIFNMVSLRYGYQTNHDLATWSAGAGFNTSLSDYDVEVNYSFSKMDIFSNVNRLSLKFSF
jgi:hypothetical protein